MSILGPALKAELADVLGVKALRDELRALRQELSGLRAAVGGSTRARGMAAKDSGPSITASQVRALRDNLGETRKAFAARLKVSPSIIFMWESGRSTPRRGAIVQRLQALMSSTGNRTPTNGTVSAVRSDERRSLKLSPKRRAALKLQGQYMGHLRNLNPKDKAQVKALKADKGFLPAIKLAKKLAEA
jgi:DNA-binding transcriptional regulator YiaG